MADGLSLDMSEVESFAQALMAEPAKTVVKARAVFQKGALNVKKAMQADAAGHRSPIDRAITYETKLGADIDVEIGPEKGGAGSLAFYWFGNSKTGPSVAEPMLRLMQEAPNIERFLGEIGSDIG